MNDFEREKYSRQILLFGDEGQEKLKNAKVLVAGAGGLGSPVSTYLAIAGVGKIILSDFDSVDPSNLNRQFLHHEKDIGRLKVESAKEKLLSMNLQSSPKPASLHSILTATSLLLMEYSGPSGSSSSLTTLRFFRKRALNASRHPGLLI